MQNMFYIEIKKKKKLKPIYSLPTYIFPKLNILITDSNN